MSRRQPELCRVLAIDPTVRGFGFAVFEGPEKLIDWGVTQSRRNKNEWSLRKARNLLDGYKPDVLVVENPNGNGSRRCERVCCLIEEISGIARHRRIRVRTFSRGDIRDAFAKLGASTKYEIAAVISRWLPELKTSMPHYRKPWMAEDARVNIFDAAALGLTYFFEVGDT